MYNLIDFCKLNTPFLLPLILWDRLSWKQCQKSKFESLDIYDAIFFFKLLRAYGNFGELVVNHIALKNNMWLHLNSHKNSIFKTIMKFNPFTQINKTYYKRN